MNSITKHYIQPPPPPARAGWNYDHYFLAQLTKIKQQTAKPTVPKGN